MRLRLVSVLIYVFLCSAVFAQVNTLTAIKAAQAPKIDGHLDDAAWQNAPVATDFIQNYPNYGQPSTNNTRVKILYDDNAVYVGAYLYDDPSLVRTQLTARDGEQREDVDYFSVFLDTYNDQQNGFQFLVTAVNAQTDSKLVGGSSSNSFGDYGDRSWDAVWQSKTSMQKDGWVVEMRIPYISLRFAKKEVQTWGLQFLRFSRRNNEASFWNPVNPNTSGFVNQFGKLENLRDIQPPLRLSFSPYLSGGYKETPYAAGTEKQFLHNGGMDVKYGINESFTLDVTLVPDFGQVISDNVINNITPYEVKFKENRPFFTEGTELFNKAGLFYSRRIGNVPYDYYTVKNLVAYNNQYELKKNPGITQLYNALKFSGRTKKKLGIGVFNAVTAPMHAVLNNAYTKGDTSIVTEALTNYNILVLDQAFKGRSYITFTNTNVMRNGTLRDANVSAINFAAYDRTNTFAVSGAMRYSRIFGYTSYNFLNAPYRYIAHLDTTRLQGRLYAMPYDGFKTNATIGKVSGKWQYTASVNAASTNYDPNDLGYLSAPNKVNYVAQAGYNQFTPTRHFISYNYGMQVVLSYLYQPYNFTNMEVTGNGAWVFKNFWDIYINAGVQPYWQNDYFELQTKGVFVKKPPYLFAFVGGSTDSRKRLFVNYEAGMADGGCFKNNNYISLTGGLRYRFSKKLNISLNAERRHDHLQIGYAFMREANGAPILGFRDYKDISAVLSGSYNFTPVMNFTLRARHYWNKLNYLSFYDVKADGFYQDRPFINGQDENFNAFNLDAFFTWDFKPGSRIIVGWKNALGDDNLFDLYGAQYNRYSKNLTNSFSLPHGNELTLRVIYFLDYNQLRHKF